ncbi:MAG: hypothetical protein D6735_05875, partial [Acidobacteria bacterium]
YKGYIETLSDRLYSSHMEFLEFSRRSKSVLFAKAQEEKPIISAAMFIRDTAGDMFRNMARGAVNTKLHKEYERIIRDEQMPTNELLQAYESLLRAEYKDDIEVTKIFLNKNIRDTIHSLFK